MEREKEFLLPRFYAGGWDDGKDIDTQIRNVPSNVTRPLGSLT